MPGNGSRPPMPCKGQDLKRAKARPAVLRDKLQQDTNILLGDCVEALQKALGLHEPADLDAFAHTAFDDIYGAVCKASLPAEKKITPLLMVKLLISADKGCAGVSHGQMW